jgi:hypothetical protein
VLRSEVPSAVRSEGDSEAVPALVQELRLVLAPAVQLKIFAEVVRTAMN